MLAEGNARLLQRRPTRPMLWDMRWTLLLDRWDRLGPWARLRLGIVLGQIGIWAIVLVTLLAEALFNVRTPAVSFLLPVLLASCFGLAPGLATTIVAVLVIDYFFIEPVGLWPPSTLNDVLVLVSLAGLAVIVSALVAALTRTRRTYQSLVQAAPMPILRTDPQGRITGANPAAALLFGRSVDALLGDSLERLLGGDEHGERPWRRITGPLGSRAVRDVRAQQPGAQGSICMLQDVTTEADLLEHKEAFLLRVAHELRTPVTAQSALLEVLASAEGLGPQARQLAESALAASWRLEALVESVLELPSIRAGEFQIEPAPVALQQVIGEAVTMVEPLLRLRQQHVELDLPRRSVMVHADRRRLVQVLVNLLSNASRYGADRQVVNLAMIRSDGRVLVEVRNQRGPEGRPEDPSRGLGLGLTIARAIVEAHHGRLDLELAEREALARFSLPLVSTVG